MDEIRECTAKLVETIQKSEVYQNYVEAQRMVMADSKLRSTVNEFRRRAYEIQNNEDPDGIYEQTEKLERDFYIVRKNDVMNQYLQAELAMCRTLQMISEKLIEVVDFDIEDFADTIKW